MLEADAIKSSFDAITFKNGTLIFLRSTGNSVLLSSLEHSKDITTSDGKTFVRTTNNFRKEDDNNKVKRTTPLGIEN